MRDRAIESAADEDRQAAGYARLRKIFDATVQCYVSCKAYPPICASRLNHEQRPSQRTSPDSTHFCVDLERATERVLTNPTYQRAWFKLAFGESVEPKLAHEVIQRCGRIYDVRGLAPYRYFKTVRQGSALSRRVGVAV